jgi:hypothetical protein
MTVCIAAVCEAHSGNGPFVVVAADRMITIGELEYEPAQTKLINLATRTVALFAGDVQFHAAVVPRVVAWFKDVGDEGQNITVAKDEGQNITVAKIAELYAEEYACYRAKWRSVKFCFG